MPPPAGLTGGGLAAAWWLIGAPALLLAGSLGPDGFSPTNFVQRGLFGAAVWSAAVVPAALGARFVSGPWARGLVWVWGLGLGAAAAAWQGGTWGHPSSWLAGAAWLLIVPAGAWPAVTLQDSDGAPRRSLIRGGLTAVAGTALWVASGFLPAG